MAIVGMIKSTNDLSDYWSCQCNYNCHHLKRGGGQASSLHANPGTGSTPGARSLLSLAMPRQDPAAAWHGQRSRCRPCTWAAACRSLFAKRGPGEERVRTGPCPARTPRSQGSPAAQDFSYLLARSLCMLAPIKKISCMPSGKPLDLATPLFSPL